MRIYIASPMGFSESAHAWYASAMLPRIALAGHDAVDQWTLIDQRRIAAVAAMPPGAEREDAWRKLNREIARAARAAIEGADMVLAVLEGADVESGTATDVGYAFALGKPIFGYRSDFRLAGENEGCVVSIALEGCILDSGGRIVRALGDLDAVLAEAEDLLVGLRGIARAEPRGGTDAVA